MSDRNFFDTNIFVYSVDSGAPQSKATPATVLIRAGIANRNAVVSYQVIQEFVNVALRKFDVPMIPSDLGEYIDRSFRRMAIVHSSLELFHAALTMHDSVQRGYAAWREIWRRPNSGPFPLVPRAAHGHRMHHRHVVDGF